MSFYLLIHAYILHVYQSFWNYRSIYAKCNCVSLVIIYEFETDSMDIAIVKGYVCHYTQLCFNVMLYNLEGKKALNSIDLVYELSASQN